MGSQSTVIAYSPLQSVNSSTFTGSYIPLGIPTPTTSRIFKIVNNSNVLITVSTDGVTDMDILPANSFSLYDLGSNRGNPSADTSLAKHTQFYIKASAGTGFVYLVVLFANTPNQIVPF